MRPSSLFAAAAALATAALVAPGPASAQAQAHVLLGIGLSSPAGSFTTVAAPGYNGRLGLQVGLPHTPVSFRIEGEADRFPSSQSSGNVTVVSGSGSVLFSLHWMGTSPYVLGGVGEYSTSSTDIGVPSSVGGGYHLGVGLSFGGTRTGGFAEVGFTNANGSSYETRFFSVTLGLLL